MLVNNYRCGVEQNYSSTLRRGQIQDYGNWLPNENVQSLYRRGEPRAEDSPKSTNGESRWWPHGAQRRYDSARESWPSLQNTEKLSTRCSLASEGHGFRRRLRRQQVGILQGGVSGKGAPEKNVPIGPKIRCQRRIEEGSIGAFTLS